MKFISSVVAFYADSDDVCHFTECAFRNIQLCLLPEHPRSMHKQYTGNCLPVNCSVFTTCFVLLNHICLVNVARARVNKKADNYTNICIQGKDTDHQNQHKMTSQHLNFIKNFDSMSHEFHF